MIYKLTKITSSHNNLSKDVYVGYCQDEPSLGHSIKLWHERNGVARFLTTTPVKFMEMTGNDSWIVKTKNSTYLLKKLLVAWNDEDEMSMATTGKLHVYETKEEGK